jgi:MFS family permease
MTRTPRRDAPSYRYLSHREQVVVRSQRGIPLALASVATVFASQVAAFVLVPLSAAERGASGGLIGVLLAIPPLTALIADPVVAVLSDAVGRKRPLVIGSILSIAAVAAFTTATNSRALAVGAVLLGVSISFSVAPLLAYLTELVDEPDYGRVQGYNGATQATGGLAGGLLAGLAAQTFGVATALLLVPGTLSVASAITFLLMPGSSGGPGQLRSPRHLAVSYVRAAEMWAKRPRVQIASVISLMYSALVFVIGNGFLPLYVLLELHESAAVAGALIATRSAVAALASLLFGRLSARLSLFRAIVAANSLTVIGLFTLAVAHDVSGVVVAMVLQGAGTAFGPASTNILVAQVTSSGERALGFAANNIVSRIGSLGSPLLFGLLLQSRGSRGVFYSAAIIALFLVVAMFIRMSSLGARAASFIGQGQRDVQ